MSHGITPLQPRGYIALGEPGWNVAACLQDDTTAIARLEAERAEHVAELRRRGASWAVVGWIVGTSGEAARKRWSGAEREREQA